MRKPNRVTAFSFAEIMIAAPWAYSILSQDHEYDKSSMLHCNSGGDEWSGSDVWHVRTLEAEARAARANALVNGFRRLKHAGGLALATLVPGRRAAKA